MTSTDRVALARLWAIALAVLAFLPYVNWIAGGPEAPRYADSATEWLSGSAISVGFAIVLFVILRRFGRWPSGWLRLAEGEPIAAHRSPRQSLA